MKDDESLAHFKSQPDRLIEEFKKLKLVKNKAAQFAIEAKQTAQKVIFSIHSNSAHTTVLPAKTPKNAILCVCFIFQSIVSTQCAYQNDHQPSLIEW